jgi:hypothetical protein
MKTDEQRKAHNRRNQKYSRTAKGRATHTKSAKLYRQTKKFKAAIEKHRNKFPERRKAGIILTNALATSKIIRPPNCVICKTVCTPQAHHPNYSEPLEVIWLCHSCHMALHWSAYSK